MRGSNNIRWLHKIESVILLATQSGSMIGSSRGNLHQETYDSQMSAGTNSNRFYYKLMFWGINYICSNIFTAQVCCSEPHKKYIDTIIKITFECFGVNMFILLANERKHNFIGVNYMPFTWSCECLTTINPQLLEIVDRCLLMY